jgi:hypothetical protein
MQDTNYLIFSAMLKSLVEVCFKLFIHKIHLEEIDIFSLRDGLNLNGFIVIINFFIFIFVEILV